MNRDRVQAVLGRDFDQGATAEERSELLPVILASAQARGAFWQAARWHASLPDWAAAKAALGPAAAAERISPREFPVA